MNWRKSRNSRRTGKTEDSKEQKQGMKLMVQKNLIDGTEEPWYRTKEILLYKGLNK